MLAPLHVAVSSVTDVELNDTLTILVTTDKHLAAKSIRLTDREAEIVNFDAGAKFLIETVTLSNIHALARKLESLAPDPTRFVIRGQLGPNRRPNKDGTVFRRKVVPNSTWKGYFASVPRRWVCIDMDQLRLPPGLSQIADPEAVVRAALVLLGEPWKSATVWWQASSKAGLPGINKIKLHLWFWLDAPVDDKRLRAKFRQMNQKEGQRLVDEALADEIQVHYTAAPVFVEGIDPLPRRHGLVAGRHDAVSVARMCLPSVRTKKTNVKSAGAKTQQTAPVHAEIVAAADHATVFHSKSTIRLRTKEPDRRTIGVLAPPNANSVICQPQRHRPKATLYQAILEDILALANCRFGSAGVGDGERDTFLFTAVVAAVNVQPAAFHATTRALAAILVPDKSDEWIQTKLVSLQSRVSKHVDGKQDVQRGRTVSPIYSPSVQWFIDRLAITEVEMAKMSKLITPTIRKRRERARQPRHEWVAAHKARSTEQALIAAEMYFRRSMRPGEAASLLHVSERRFWSLLRLMFADTH